MTDSAKKKQTSPAGFGYSTCSNGLHPTPNSNPEIGLRPMNKPVSDHFNPNASIGHWSTKTPDRRGLKKQFFNPEIVVSH